MATIQLTLPPLPVHVRTARLICVTAGRRARLPDDLVDELRLAVGEACSRAVALHAVHAPETPVLIELDDSGGRLTVLVSDSGPPPAGYEVPVQELLSESPEDPNVALAFLAGLVDDMAVDGGTEGTTVRLSWPLLAPVR